MAVDDEDDDGGAVVLQLRTRIDAKTEVAAPVAPSDEARPGDSDEGGAKPVERDDLGLPKGCPVRPLGRFNSHFYYLDELDQLVSLTARDHSRNHLAALFGRQSHLLHVWWPRKKEVKEKVEGADGREETVSKWKVIGFKADEAADDLMRACSRKGLWKSVDRVRGIGAWTDEAGGLVLHCGDALLTHDDELAPGEIGVHVYPAAPAIARPWPEPVPGGEHGPGEVVLSMLKTWNWARPEIDPMLMLGFACASKIGGALDWRPMSFVTGDLATGKSTLHDLYRLLMGEALVQTADTTAAGLYQHLGQSYLPVAIDELEADADNRRAGEVMKLARLAASGAVQLRGGADHKGVEFTARSTFLFSSILIPPMEPQDASRMAILDLKELANDVRAPKLDRKEMLALGAKLTRRIVDQWPRLADTLELYELALVRVGHTQRGAKQFGTLLACADLALFDREPDTDSADEWAEKMRPDQLAEIAQVVSNAQTCLDYLLQARPDEWMKGSKVTVAQLVEETVFGESAAANAGSLAIGGMAVVRDAGGKGACKWLAVARTHRGTAELFKDSKWQSKPGVVGVWAQALARLPGAVASKPQRVGPGPQVRCVLVPIELVTDKIKRAETAEEVEL